MRDILSRITKWWEAGESFSLATVVRTYRSAPRDPGAALAVSLAGQDEVAGSVSGGCVEGAVYELALEVGRTGDPVLESYGSATTMRSHWPGPGRPHPGGDRGVHRG